MVVIPHFVWASLNLTIGDWVTKREKKREKTKY
jgi:hypothetical protein